MDPIKMYLNFIFASTSLILLESIAQGFPGIDSSRQVVYSGVKAHDGTELHKRRFIS